MLIGWLSEPRGGSGFDGGGGGAGRRRIRIAALVVGTLATLAMVVVGCTTVTDGIPRVDAKEAPTYRASMSASVEASAATSSQRESQRQQSLTTQAIHTSCEALSSSSADAIDKVNDYVTAYNQNSGDVQSKVGPAVDALHRSADQVAGSMTDPVSSEIKDAMNAWIDAARAVATAISSGASTEEFNTAITKLNDSRSTALGLCDATYR
ncbi:MAG: hypothetical protein JWR37_4603 [Mycobacterium sp.]|nr:hypothetical protein [Mycobacterium sp.]